MIARQYQGTYASARPASIAAMIPAATSPARANSNVFSVQ